MQVNKDMNISLSLSVVSWTVTAISRRPALYSSFPLQRWVGPGCRRSCREHGAWSRAGCCATQHHRLWVRADARTHMWSSLFYYLNKTPSVLFFSPGMTWSSHEVGWFLSYVNMWRTRTLVFLFPISSLWLLRSSREVIKVCDALLNNNWDGGFASSDVSALGCSWRVGASRTETGG